MTIAEIVERYPDTVDILIKYGFHCIGCALASYETIEQGAKAHGLSSKDIKKLLTELNTITKKLESDTSK
ncbi:DUF1858 domain-containing protein [Candidatus Dojkabacteria bacterium]|nr:DUF1858 domain-containing protein [Candidatus Dojkabacteria bacterium]